MFSEARKMRLRNASARKLRQGEFFLHVRTGDLFYDSSLNSYLDNDSLDMVDFPGFWKILSEKDRSQLLRKAAFARRRNRDISHNVYITTGIGRGVWLQLSMCYTHDNDELYLAGFVRDVTREQIIIGELEKTANFFESIVDNIPNMIFVKEAKELRFIRLNKAGEEVFGMKNERILGKNDYDFFPPDQADFFVSKDRKVIASGELEVIEEEPIDTSAGRRYLRTKKIPIFTPDGEPLFLLGISEDVTEKKASEELIREQRQALLQASKMSALGEMAGGIAHEINNPLAIMRGYADFMIHLMENEGVEKKQLTDYCTKIVETTDRIAKIIKGLKGFARDGADDPLLPVNIKSLVDGTLEFCRERFKFHNVEVQLKDIPDVEIICQETQISQVLLNLLNNAFDAVLDRENAWVSIEAQLVGQRVKIYVRDAGEGIPAEIEDKVMLPFFTTKEVGRGTGLGLSISRGIVESHKGKLYFDNKAATTSVVIELPIDPERIKQVG